MLKRYWILSTQVHFFSFFCVGVCVCSTKYFSPNELILSLQLSSFTMKKWCITCSAIIHCIQWKSFIQCLSNQLKWTNSNATNMGYIYLWETNSIYEKAKSIVRLFRFFFLVLQLNTKEIKFYRTLMLFTYIVRTHLITFE